MDSKEKSRDKKDDQNLVEEKPKVRAPWLVRDLVL
jgi:hypothetical protein